VPPVRFGVLTTLGSAVWLSAMALIGYSVGGSWRSIMHGFSYAGYLLIAGAILALAFVIYHRYRSYHAAMARDAEAKAAAVEASAQPLQASPVAGGPRGGGQPVSGQATAPQASPGALSTSPSSRSDGEASRSGSDKGRHFRK
jgi:hypothetical protein